VAQTWRRRRAEAKEGPPPLDAARLERLALRYVERYATTTARLRTYLARKLRERGWDGQEPPDLDALTERMAALGYVDDQAYAVMKSDALTRRGFGRRRVAAALHRAGIGKDAIPQQSEEEAWEAALRFARRRKLGPFAVVWAKGPEREKALAALLRAGHSIDLARALIDAAPGAVPQRDDC
jgi:regulatory protein